MIEREKAEIGVLITLHEPTHPMRAEAASAGFYQSPWGEKLARLQIVTVGELLEGREVKIPRENVTFKKAPKAEKDKPEQLNL